MALCGIDEAGRGPIAGSLVVAGVVLNKPVEGLMDSKKISEKKRELLYPQIIESATYHIVTFPAHSVDELGISECMSIALQEIQSTIKCDNYLVDGNTTFGVKNLKTMVKADAKVEEVSAASILAKVTHDREMIEFSKTYPEYDFEKHKGYGTKAHIEAIKKYGYTPEHRRSFKLKALEATLF
ncbi:ribonuclease HII [Sulfurimonas sp. HSL3-7]|uniref:ribonuclease HII n=1 Tax=Sulfonitrofixus jiaomeiensis TaxID=3131938 RepID=UPI0031F9B85B